MREKAGAIVFISAILSKFLALCWSREHGTALFKGMLMEQRFRSSFLSRNNLLFSSFHQFPQKSLIY